MYRLPAIGGEKSMYTEQESPLANAIVDRRRQKERRKKNAIASKNSPKSPLPPLPGHAHHKTQSNNQSLLTSGAGWVTSHLPFCVK